MERGLNSLQHREDSFPPIIECGISDTSLAISDNPLNLMRLSSFFRVLFNSNAWLLRHQMRAECTSLFLDSNVLD